jgi:hypothetical protein
LLLSILLRLRLMQAHANHLTRRLLLLLCLMLLRRLINKFRLRLRCLMLLFPQTLLPRQML